MENLEGFCPTLKRCISSLFQALPAQLASQLKSKVTHEDELFVELQPHRDLVNPSLDFPI